MAITAHVPRKSQPTLAAWTTNARAQARLNQKMPTSTGKARHIRAALRSWTLRARGEEVRFPRVDRRRMVGGSGARLEASESDQPAGKRSEAAQRRTGQRRTGQRLTRLTTALVLCLGMASTGCVGTVYAVKASSAASKLEQAKVLGAEKYCPYEYYFAKANLLKAQEEAAQAAYGDAIDLAGLAQEYADKAIELAQGTHRGAGR